MVFLFPRTVETTSGAHSSTLFIGYSDPFPGEKLPKHEFNHSPPSSTEVRVGGAVPPICLHGVDRDNFKITENMFEGPIVHHRIPQRIRGPHVGNHCHKLSTNTQNQPFS